MDMGLTIHYSITAKLNDGEVIDAVRKMRELALDLPFKEVCEVVNLRGGDCDFEARRQELQGKNEPLFWLLIQAGQSVRCPWNKRIGRLVNPNQIVAVHTWPGLGCEAANIGLCRYPEEIDWEYNPEEDQRFQSLYRSQHCLDSYYFDREKWRRHCRRHFGEFRFPEDQVESRKVPTRLDGWQWESFCKSQYACSIAWSNDAFTPPGVENGALLRTPPTWLEPSSGILSTQNAIAPRRPLAAGEASFTKTSQREFSTSVGYRRIKGVRGHHHFRPGGVIWMSQSRLSAMTPICRPKLLNAHSAARRRSSPSRPFRGKANVP